jgi:deoxyribodipyrimidine photolyase-related protein
MAQFYAYQRKKFDILMESGKPIGGKFSFDADNRKKIPKGHVTPTVCFDQDPEFVDEAVAYVKKVFPLSIGAGEPFLYPVTRKAAKKALQDFVETRLSLFGDYEDAIRKDESFLYHSVLSPLLNVGLLTPQEVVDAVIKAYRRGAAPLNSVEGFVRQVIGWREYVRACYLVIGNRQRTQNYFKHKRQLPKGFWDGTTGIEPIDSTIKKVIKTGYCHHIERLMVFGNFLLLLEVDPNEVYEWFMGYFVDAYDWVMVSNVYGMSQYADGGMITTKPYISGSNYLLKISDYKKGEWVDVWDGLFWRFLSKHKRLFGSNPRTNMLLEMFEKNRETLVPKIEKAEKYFHLIDRMT